MTDFRRDPLPSPSPPFEVGETVAFFPAEIGPTSNWLAMGYAVIEEIDEGAESCMFHSVEEPKERFGQGFENIVRPTATYHAWRTAWQDTFRRTGDERQADAETESLRIRVLAEHPIHGNGPYAMPGRHLKE